MFFTIKRNTLILFSVAIAAAALAACFAVRPAVPAFSAAGDEPTVYVLDAGHGGEDGGALTAQGEKESDINLAVTLRLDALLRFLGCDTLLIRTDDVSIYSDGSQTLRQKKVSDLRNRVALIHDTPGAVLVSIHQNSMPTVPSVHGAQVFYGVVPPGDELAQSVQSALNRCVNTDGEKHEKQIDPSIYLMKHADCPAILVECGFLSNDAEAAKLQTAEHQKKLAAAIAAGILDTEEREVP